MRVIEAPDDGVIFLGKQGENNATQIRFTVEEWIAELGSGTFQLLHQRLTDTDPHAVVVTYADGVVSWDVANTELAVVGNGKCELQFYQGTTLAKSRTWITMTLESMSDVGSTPPAAWESWVEEVLASANAISSTVLNADYTLTINFTNGTSYTTPSIRGAKGEKGDSGEIGGSLPWSNITDKPSTFPPSEHTHDDRYARYDDDQTLSDSAKETARDNIGAAAETDLTTHIADSVKHITANERTAWNGKQDSISDLSDIRSGAELGATALQSVPTTYRTSAAQDAIDDTKVDKVTGKGLSANDYSDTEKSKVTANTTARHTHSNKALLDTYTQTEADIADAVSKKHSHDNKSVLDDITAALVTAWDSAVTWITTNGANVISHIANTSNPHSVTKAQVGLGNVNNTSDADKPISTATQTALDGKENVGKITIGGVEKTASSHTITIVTDGTTTNLTIVGVT